MLSLFVLAKRCGVSQGLLLRYVSEGILVPVSGEGGDALFSEDAVSIVGAVKGRVIWDSVLVANHLGVSVAVLAKRVDLGEIAALVVTPGGMFFDGHCVQKQYPYRQGNLLEDDEVNEIIRGNLGCSSSFGWVTAWVKLGILIPAYSFRGKHLFSEGQLEYINRLTVGWGRLWKWGSKDNLKCRKYGLDDVKNRIQSGELVPLCCAGDALWFDCYVSDDAIRLGITGMLSAYRFGEEVGITQEVLQDWVDRGIIHPAYQVYKDMYFLPEWVGIYAGLCEDGIYTLQEVKKELNVDQFIKAEVYLNSSLVSIKYNLPLENEIQLLTFSAALELAVRELGVVTFGGLAGIYHKPEEVFEELWRSGELKEELCVFGTPLFKSQSAGLLLGVGKSKKKASTVRKGLKSARVGKKPDMVALPEFAGLLGVSMQTLGKWVQSGRLAPVNGCVPRNLVGTYRKLVNKQVLSLAELSERLGVSPEEVKEYAEPCLVVEGRLFYLPGQVNAVKIRLVDGLLSLSDFAGYCGVESEKVGYLLKTGQLKAEKEVAGELYFSTQQVDLVADAKLPRFWRLKKILGQ